MFNLIQSIKSLFSANSSSETVVEYNWDSMNLKRGRGSNFWSDEKVARLLELLDKGYTHKQVGQALHATRGQIATKIAQLRSLGVKVQGTSSPRSTSACSKPIKSKVTKKDIDNAIKKVK